jgi:hypothetical protein
MKYMSKSMEFAQIAGTCRLGYFVATWQLYIGCYAAHNLASELWLC